MFFLSAVWHVEYTIEYPNDFLVRARPKANLPAKKKMIYDQVEELETYLR